VYNKIKDVIKIINKPKVYLDTSVISHLFQDEKPEAKGYTLEFWEKIKNGEFEVFISRVVIEEIERAPKEKVLLMNKALDEIDYTLIFMSSEIRELAEKIISMGILPSKSVNDSAHIAAAVFNNCDFLATWNIKHLANYKTNDGVRSLFVEDNQSFLQIIPPSFLTGGL
jgi:predicted nucleic acid-binding protein